MAEHADPSSQIDAAALLDEESGIAKCGTDDRATDVAKTSARQMPSDTGALIALGFVIVAVLAGVAGWLGYSAYQDREAQAQRNLYVQVARQEAVNLTTINYTQVESDIKRILESATGTFLDDFQKRSQPFVDVIKKVQSKSEGTVAEAALTSKTDDEAQVLVAVSVKTSIAAAPEQEPRRWRLRITVQKTSDSAKVSNVEFVP